MPREFVIPLCFATHASFLYSFVGRVVYSLPYENLHIHQLPCTVLVRLGAVGRTRIGQAGEESERARASKRGERERRERERRERDKRLRALIRSSSEWGGGASEWQITTKSICTKAIPSSGSLCIYLFIYVYIYSDFSTTHVHARR